MEEVPIPKFYRCSEEDDCNECEVDRDEVKDGFATPARIRGSQLTADGRGD